LKGKFIIFHLQKQETPRQMGWGGGKAPGQVRGSGAAGEKSPFSSPSGGREVPGSPPAAAAMRKSGLIFTIWLKH